MPPSKRHTPSVCRSAGVVRVRPCRQPGQDRGPSAAYRLPRHPHRLLSHALCPVLQSASPSFGRCSVRRWPTHTVKLTFLDTLIGKLQFVCSGASRRPTIHSTYDDLRDERRACVERRYSSRVPSAAASLRSTWRCSSHRQRLPSRCPLLASPSPQMEWHTTMEECSVRPIRLRV